MHERSNLCTQRHKSTEIPSSEFFSHDELLKILKSKLSMDSKRMEVSERLISATGEML